MIAGRKHLARELEDMVDAHPLAQVLTSDLNAWDRGQDRVRTAARILLEVGDGTFPTPGHLHAYASLPPVTRRSGTSILQDPRRKITRYTACE